MRHRKLVALAVICLTALLVLSCGGKSVKGRQTEMYKVEIALLVKECAWKDLELLYVSGVYHRNIITYESKAYLKDAEFRDHISSKMTKTVSLTRKSWLGTRTEDITYPPGIDWLVMDGQC